MGKIISLLTKRVLYGNKWHLAERMVSILSSLDKGIPVIY